MTTPRVVSKAALDSFVRQAGLLGGLQSAPAVLAMMTGAEDIPPEMEQLAGALGGAAPVEITVAVGGTVLLALRFE